MNDVSEKLERRFSRILQNRPRLMETILTLAGRDALASSQLLLFITDYLCNHKDLQTKREQELKLILEYFRKARIYDQELYSLLKGFHRKSILEHALTWKIFN